MKILQINAVYKTGSTGRINFDYQNYINKTTEHTCRSVFSYGGTPEDGFVIGNKLDRMIHGLLSRLFGKQGWFSRGATKKLLKYIDEYSPDVIQIGNPHGNFLNFPMLMKYVAEKDIATVITVHDCWAFTGKCCHYTVDKCYRWQTGCHDCPRLHKDNKSWFMDKTAQMWKEKRELYNKIPRLAIVGSSQWVTDEAAKSPLLENAKVFINIYVGIDETVFKPTPSDIKEKYNLQNKKIILGVASDWINNKGLEDAIKMSKILPDDCQVVLVGNIVEPLPECNIINIPRTESVEELVKWYSAADVFMNLSKEETFGKVSAEALMCGTPVVCYNTTANPELIGDNCGYVCESESVEDFKEFVMKVLENGKEKYMDSCVSFARANFDVAGNNARYLELYKSLAEEQK